MRDGDKEVTLISSSHHHPLFGHLLFLSACITIHPWITSTFCLIADVMVFVVFTDAFLGNSFKQQ